METRKELIVDVESFNEINLKLHNEKRTVDKLGYKNLENRILCLTKDDFENSEKYNRFIEFINQPERKIKRMMLEESFKDDYLEIGAYLFLSNDLDGIVSWLK